MVQYDQAVIQEFAEKLYKRANSIILSYTVVGMLLGGLGGYFLHDSIGGDVMTTAGIPAVVVAIIGFVLGLEKAFLLKLQAQTALCQMKIEQNTSGRIV